MNMYPLYTMSGAPFYTKGYAITASEDFAKHAVIVHDGAGAVAEAADDSSDVWGLALEKVVSGVSGGPQSDICLVHQFNYDTVYACKNVSDLTDVPVAADIGTIADLDLSDGYWGILVDTSATANTPQFRIVDIDTIRNEWHVIIAPLDVTDVFQPIDAAV